MDDRPRPDLLPAPLAPPARPKRPCTIAVEKRRLGGRVRTGQVPSPHDADPETAQAARLAAFCDLQRRRGAHGAAVTRARYGPKRQAEILAAYYRAHPTNLERFVADVLDGDGVDYAREVIVEIALDLTYWRLDFVLPGAGADGLDLVIEPGAAHWHDPARDAVRYATLAPLGYPHILTLTDSEILQTPDAATARIRAFIAGGGAHPPAPAPEVPYDYDAHVPPCALYAPAA